MTIHEIVQKTGLTKKAINYYEEMGLIAPEHNPENRYRIFTEQDLKRLAIIALLRQLDVPLEKIRPVLEGKISMSALLQQRLHTIEADIESLKAEKKIVAAAIANEQIAPLEVAAPENIIAIKDEITLNQFRRQNAIRSQWQKIFPGNLGRLFSLIYNAHLTEPIDTREKREAWAAFVEQLDQIEEIDIPDDVKLVLESKTFESHLHELESHYGTAMLRFSNLDNARIAAEMPTPPPAEIAQLPPEKVELVRGLLKISAFVREELGERLAPLKKYLGVLSDTYNRTMENLSFMNELIHERADYQSSLELFARLRDEARR